MGNPFQSAAGSTVAANNPFMQPASGGNFPKIDDYFSRLVLLTPVKLETVPKAEKFGGGTQERFTADVVVLDGGEFEFGELPYEVDGMYFSQANIVGALKGAQRKATAVLGRIQRQPIKDDRPKYTDAATGKLDLVKFEADLAKDRNLSFAWGIGEFTDADAALAMKYLENKPSF